jgi:hypothetical protein
MGERHTIADALAFLSGHKAVIRGERGAIIRFVDAISHLDLDVWVGECSQAFVKSNFLSLSIVGRRSQYRRYRTWHVDFDLRSLLLRLWPTSRQ